MPLNPQTSRAGDKPRSKPFGNNFNAEPPYTQAIHEGVMSFPEEVSGAGRKAFGQQNTGREISVLSYNQNSRHNDKNKNNSPGPLPRPPAR